MVTKASAKRSTTAPARAKAQRAASKGAQQRPRKRLQPSASSAAAKRAVRQPHPHEPGTAPAPTFTGFAPVAFEFLRGLAEHQNRLWMANHKHLYDSELHAPMGALITALSERLKGTRLGLQGDARRSIFRMHRDVRFSKDKAPYKTHVGAVLTRHAERHALGVLYIHIEVQASYAAVGFFQPEAKVLKQLRQGLVARASAWRRMVRQLQAHGLELVRTDALSRAPLGFDGVPEHLAADLRLKSWIVRTALDHAELGQEDLVQRLASFATAAAPLLRFGWQILDKQPSAASDSEGR